MAGGSLFHMSWTPNLLEGRNFFSPCTAFTLFHRPIDWLPSTHSQLLTDSNFLGQVLLVKSQQPQNTLDLKIQ